MLAGALLLAVVWVFLLRYVPDGVLATGGSRGRGSGLFVPNRSDLCPLSPATGSRRAGERG